MLAIVMQVGALLAAVWLQLSWFSHVRPLGVMPNVVLAVVVVTALWARATTAVASAVLCGLLLDLASGSDFGLRTAFFTVVTLAIISARQFGLYAESFSLAAAVVVISTIVANLFIVLGVVGSTAGIDWAVVVQRTGIEAIFNVIVVGVLFAVRELTRDRRARITSELRRGSWL
ncbi:hypothetical protein EPO04_01760 [Patescibacteria group bacterium]|nr:MAG: hypothetical protein EPO04_01760 [Patescibacteria group bacterium]